MIELTQVLDLFSRWLEGVIDRRLAKYGLIPQDSQPLWGTKYEAAPLAGCSPDTLKNWRKEFGWIEGVHYRRVSAKETVYNLPLMADFGANRHRPEEHLSAVQMMASALSQAAPARQKPKGSLAGAPGGCAPFARPSQLRSPRTRSRG